MTNGFNDKDNEAIKQKISIIKGFLGTELDVALTVLSYALADVAVGNGVTFHSIVKNLSLIWEHVDTETEEGEDDANY